MRFGKGASILISLHKQATTTPKIRDHLSAWRTLARNGKLVVPEIAGAEFAAPIALAQPVETPVSTASIDLLIGPVTVRLDAATPAAQVAELVMALRARP